MNILIGCEFSGRVRDTYRKLGYEAWSCDIDPCTSSEYSQYHLQCDIFEAIASKKWDMMIAFPPCTYLTIAGNRYYAKDPRRQEAVEFVKRLYFSDIQHIAIENPVGALSTRWKKPSQIIHPWWYGHFESKRTCLWLKNLPLLTPENIVKPLVSATDNYSGSYHNARKVRSLTFHGVAQAMGKQWHPERILQRQNSAEASS